MLNPTGGEKNFYTTFAERSSATNRKSGLAGPGTAADFTLRNGKLLSQMMSTLPSCSAVKTGAKYHFTLPAMAKCHVAAAGGRASTVQQIYNEQFGGGI